MGGGSQDARAGGDAGIYLASGVLVVTAANEM
jgi:hypothetical protein